MKILDFVNALNIKEVQEYIKKEYGWGINQQHYRKKEYWDTQVVDILKKIENKATKKISYSLRNLVKENDMSQFGQVIQNLESKIKDVNNYIIDIESIVYLSFIQSYSVNDDDYIGELQKSWKSGTYNKNINLENAKKYYPFSSEDLLQSNVREGCREYHKLMMKAQNMAIFDFNKEIKSLKRYSFPQTYQIYEQLKGTSVDNLIFLELTQGLCYTDTIYKYTKEIEDKEKLNKLLFLVDWGIYLKPNFFRCDLFEEIFRFLYVNQFQDELIDCAMRILNRIIDSVNWTYMELLKVIWTVYKSYYDEAIYTEQMEFLATGQIEINGMLKNYFLQDDIYKTWIKDEKLYDWRNINTVEECFICVDERNPVNDKTEYSDIYFKIKSEKHQEKITSNEAYQLMRVPRYCNDIGERIYWCVFEKIKYMEFNDEEECVETYKALCKKEYNKLYQTEKALWNSKDPKANVSKLKHIHVYAILHERIVRMLNRI